MLCKEENKLFRKYGLELKDFEGDDWRNIFDTYKNREWLERVERYIAPIQMQRFLRDLYALQRRKDQVFDLYAQLEKLIDDESASNLYDLLIEAGQSE